MKLEKKLHHRNGMIIFIFITAVLQGSYGEFSTPRPSLTTKPRVQLPEENFDVPELLRYWGYPVETHSALTKDGYYLTLHRIPHGKNTVESDNSNRSKPVMFLHHGAVGSSADFLLNLPHQSLGFMLADAGYDVWMGNSRGNSYSKRHAKLQVNSSEFWDFTFQEMAEYDFPTMINYTLENTGVKDLYYVGFSQGSMIAFASLSENIDLQKKIKGIFALGPAAKLDNIYSPIRYFAKLDYVLWGISKMFGIREILSSSKYMNHLAQNVCPHHRKLCSDFIFVLSGYDRKNFNETRLPVYMTHNPAGTSMKNLLHYCQLVKTGDFKKYDYGWVSNLKKYGEFWAPNYHIERINVPMVLVVGTADWLTPPDDVDWLSKKLTNVLEVITVEGYNHLDYVWSSSAGKKINKKLINIARTRMV